MTLVALNFERNGMDTIKREIRCSAEEWKNRSLSMPWRRMGKQTSGFIQR